MNKQITLPIWVPAELEEYISTITTRSSDEHRILIPAYNRRYPNADNRAHRIPALTETSAHVSWRLRIWVIGEETMWALAHSREMDEVFEILWTLYHLQWNIGVEADFIQPMSNTGYSAQATAAEREEGSRKTFAMSLERRPVPNIVEEAEGAEEGRAGWIDAAEKQRWNEWLMDEPHEATGRAYTQGYHTLFADTNRLVPEDAWYWQGEVPEQERGLWTDAPEEAAGEIIEGASAGVKRKRTESVDVSGSIVGTTSAGIDTE